MLVRLLVEALQVIVGRASLVLNRRAAAGGIM